MKLNAIDKQTAGIKNGAYRSKSGIVTAVSMKHTLMACFQALLWSSTSSHLPLHFHYFASDSF